MARLPKLKPAIADPLVTLVVNDYSGITRGRSMSARAFDRSKNVRTCGWVPANMSLTTFDQIADPNPWGSSGDLRLMPDVTARSACWPPDADTPLDLVPSDIVELDGQSWTCCPRSFLKSALADFKRVTGCTFISSFEHEFQIFDADWQSAAAFSLAALRRAGSFGPEVMAVLDQAGLSPDVFVAEYGKDQFEVTLSPSEGLQAADRALILREIVREMARLRKWRASFSPKTTPTGVGNGVHIHFSFISAKGISIAYDPKQKGNLSDLAGQFCAGVLRHLPALTAISAPSPVSSMRLKPHNWSSSYTWLGERDREASLRICPLFTIGSKDLARQFNIEFRAADATASPHLVLGALIRAGLSGISDKLLTPPIFSGDPEKLDSGERERLGLWRLPASLAESLMAFESDPGVRQWFSPVAMETYVGLKRAELQFCDGMDVEAVCQHYSRVY